MKAKIYALMHLLYAMIDRRYSVLLRFCKAQTEIAMNRDRKKHYILSPEERQRLLTLGAEINHDVKDALVIVTWQTYQRWVRDASAGKEPQRVGRKQGITQEVRKLILRLAKENNRWGKKRIAGELKKLKILLSPSSILRILRQEGIAPDPDKKTRPAPPVSWTTFVHAHMESMVATDLFTKTIWTWKGRFDAYCLFFIHLGTRRVYHSPVTLNPDEDWMMQQARNAAMWMEDEGIKMRFLIHDRDTKYSQKFRAFFRVIVKPRKGAVLRTHIKSPQMNAFAESFVGTMRRECLGNFVCISLNQLDYLINTYIRHYLTERPHQGKGIDNEVLDPNFTPVAEGKVKCRSSLGGMLRHYYREVA